jgi:hypothetical protein
LIQQKLHRFRTFRGGGEVQGIAAVLSGGLEIGAGCDQQFE